MMTPVEMMQMQRDEDALLALVGSGISAYVAHLNLGNLDAAEKEREAVLGRMEAFLDRKAANVAKLRQS